VILVDSSVWIDYFNGASSWETDLLDRLLGSEELLIGDLILAEVLQGFQNERDFLRAEALLTSLVVVELAGREIAVRSARNFRRLRGLGVTVRKTIDCVIATRCMESGFRLLHSDRDFDAFPKHLRLQVVQPSSLS
jgi:predicted nucleic acid-binding protein